MHGMSVLSWDIPWGQGMEAWKEEVKKRCCNPLSAFPFFLALFSLLLTSWECQEIFPDLLSLGISLAVLLQWEHPWCCRMALHSPCLGFVHVPPWSLNDI